MKRMTVAFVLATAWVTGLAIAQDATSKAGGGSGAGIADRIANNPYPDGFQVYGGTHKVTKDAGVQFGKAMRITVPAAKPDQPWSVGMNVPVVKPVAKGAKLVLAFWARAEKTEGSAPGRLANVQVQHAAAPYAGLFGKAFDVGPDWKMYQLTGTADADYPAGALNAAMHFGSARQVIDIGPVFVLDMGQ